MSGLPVPWYLLMIGFLIGWIGLGSAYVVAEQIRAWGPLVQGWIGRGG
jgi:hypothetical protein